MKMAAAAAIEVDCRTHLGRILADKGQCVPASSGLPDDDDVITAHERLSGHVVDSLLDVGGAGASRRQERSAAAVSIVLQEYATGFAVAGAQWGGDDEPLADKPEGCGGVLEELKLRY